MTRARRVSRDPNKGKDRDPTDFKKSNRGITATGITRDSKAEMIRGHVGITVDSKNEMIGTLETPRDSKRAMIRHPSEFQNREPVINTIAVPLTQTMQKGFSIAALPRGIAARSFLTFNIRIWMQGKFFHVTNPLHDSSHPERNLENCLYCGIAARHCR